MKFAWRKPRPNFQIAAEVAAPLAKTDEIVLLGGADRTTTEVNKLLGQLPPAVQALTGVDLSGVSDIVSYFLLQRVSIIPKLGTGDIFTLKVDNFQIDHLFRP